MKTICSFTYIFLFSVTSMYAQTFQGTATYRSKSSIDMDFDGRQMPEAQKKMIQERMKSMLDKTFVLNFNRTTSTYKEEQKLAQPGATAGSGMRFMGMGGPKGVYFKDIQAQSFANETDIFGKPFLIVDQLKPLEWTMSGETKQIGQYTCYKATAIKPRDTTLRSIFRGFRPPRAGENKNQKEKDSTKGGAIAQGKDSLSGLTGGQSLASRLETPKETVITAWYTPDIPVSQGPGAYWGLPGLILEVTEGNTAILCTKITLNPKEKVAIEAPTKGKKISQEEYKTTMAKKVKEMSERFRGNRRGGGNRIIIRN